MAGLQDIAIDARAGDLLLDEWLNRFVATSLRALDGDAVRAASYDERVRPLRRLY